MPDCVPTSVAFSQLPHLKKHMLSIHGKLLNITQIPFSFDFLFTEIKQDNPNLIYVNYAKIFIKPNKN